MRASLVIIVGVVLVLQQCCADNSLRVKRDEDAEGGGGHNEVIIMVGVTHDGKMVIRDEEDGDWINVPNSCCITHVAGMKNGVVVGLKDDGYLYEWKSQGGVWQWVGPSPSTIKVMSLSISSTGVLIATDIKNRIVAKSQLENEWTMLENPCCVTSVTAGPYGLTMGVTRRGTLKKREALITGTWVTCKVKGPKMKQLISYPNGDVLGLTTDGCGIYDLHFEEKEWETNINEGSDVCLISANILLNPAIGVDLDHDVE